MFRAPCTVKIGDFVNSRQYSEIFGYVTNIEYNSRTGDYYVEVIYDDDSDPIYFFDDELEVVKLIKE
jgi:hypothetical protein